VRPRAGLDAAGRDSNPEPPALRRSTTRRDDRFLDYLTAQLQMKRLYEWKEVVVANKNVLCRSVPGQCVLYGCFRTVWMKPEETNGRSLPQRHQFAVLLLSP
jgi:hypothetical protein